MQKHGLVASFAIALLSTTSSGCSDGGKVTSPDDMHPADLTTSCRNVSGSLTSVIVSPPTCTGASGLCTHGSLTGDITAAYDFTGDTETMDPSNSNRTMYTGHSVITPTSGDGIITSNDTGYLDSETMTTASFQTTVNMMGGTMSYTNASGTLVAPGMADFATGMLVGTYSGQLCD